MIEGCAKLVKMEQALEAGSPIEGLMAAPAPAAAPKAPDYASMPGLGDDPLPGFSFGETPDVMPDLSEHNNIMTDVLKATPSIYDALKGKKTSLDVTLAQCIKTGMDNKGHPMIKTVGMTAGDEESYEVFRELFDPVIDIRHGGYKPGAMHPTDLDTSKLTMTPIDPTGEYVISTRVRAGRSIRGLRLPPCIKPEERRESERVVVKALLGVEGDMKGDYYPLSNSNSYIPKPGGMSAEEEDLFREEHLLFQEPDSTLLLASGMGRQWPEARGIFANDSMNFIVWCKRRTT